MTVQTTSDTTVTPDSQVHIHRTTFERIEGLRKRVGETAVSLDRATKEKKEAQGAFDTATMNLSAAVSDMLDEVNGVSKLPLFANQSEAIARAEADPIAQKLLTRLIDHGVSHLNQLVVAGYNEAQRNELAAYLDALDVRKKAEAAGAAELPELLEMPEFLAAEPPQVEVTPESTAELVARLHEQGLDLTPAHAAALTYTHWLEVFGWLNTTERIKAEKGDALVMDDLPTAPSYLVNPAEVLPASDEEPAQTSDDGAPKKERAKRRSSSTFKNSPRVTKAKKGRR